MKIKPSGVVIFLCLLVASVAIASAAMVTHSFEAQVPTNSGLMPGSYVLNVPDFITGTPQSNFMGSDFASWSAPGTGACIGEFYVGPSPISGLANDIGFGNDVCCFIHFFPDMSFTTPGATLLTRFTLLEMQHSLLPLTQTALPNQARSVWLRSRYCWLHLAFEGVGTARSAANAHLSFATCLRARGSMDGSA